MNSDQPGPLITFHCDAGVCHRDMHFVSCGGDNMSPLPSSRLPRAYLVPGRAAKVPTVLYSGYLNSGVSVVLILITGCAGSVAAATCTPVLCIPSACIRLFVGVGSFTSSL